MLYLIPDTPYQVPYSIVLTYFMKTLNPLISVSLIHTGGIFISLNTLHLHPYLCYRSAQLECIKSHHRNMYALQCHPCPHFSHYSTQLWSPHELRRHRVQRGGSWGCDSWSSVLEETGSHAEPHLLSDSVHSAGGAHHPLLSQLVFHCTVPPHTSFTTTSPPHLPQVSLFFLICSLSCIVWLRRCWIQLPRLVFASGSLEIPSGIICVFVHGVCLLPACVCLWVLIPLSVWISFISTSLGWGMLVFCLHQHCVSAAFVSAVHVS